MTDPGIGAGAIVCVVFVLLRFLYVLATGRTLEWLFIVVPVIAVFVFLIAFPFVIVLLLGGERAPKFVQDFFPLAYFCGLCSFFLLWKRKGEETTENRARRWPKANIIFIVVLIGALIFGAITHHG